MKAFLVMAVSLIAFSSKGQYYYKDIIGTKESSSIIRSYMQNRVSRVVLSSFNENNQQDSAFYVEQQFNPAERSLRTITRSGMTNESFLTSYADADGKVIRTVDSSDIVVSKTEYRYTSSGLLQFVSSGAVDSSRHSNETEVHLWSYGSNGVPQKMVRVKNGRDTTVVQFKTDERGNISEETETRKGVTSQPVYYYHNDNGQLTDIVRFSKRANRLLPEYMFEYTEDNRLKQKITVPSNSPEYMIWVYQYNDKGLKTREAIFSRHDKRKALGKIVYEYSFY